MKREIKKVLIICFLFLIMSIIGSVGSVFLYYRDNIGMGEYVKKVLIKDALPGGLVVWGISTIIATLYILKLEPYLKKK